MKRKIIWTEEVLKYLFSMAVAVTEYGTTNLTKSGLITSKGNRTITKLMQIKFPKPKKQERETFRLGNVTQVLNFVTNKQRRSTFQSSGHRHMYDKAMLAAMKEGFITGSEFADRMTT